jgi:hypothetical protein
MIFTAAGLCTAKAIRSSARHCAVFVVHRFSAHMIAATNRQPIAGLLTALAYLMVATAVCLFVVKIISFVGHL